MREQWKEFYTKAALLGHDAEKLAAGEEIVTYGTFKNLLEGKYLLSVATPEQRIARQETFITPPLIARQRLYQGRHDFAEAIIFANEEFIECDHQGPGNCMPALIKGVSVLQKRVRCGETWDLSVLASSWSTLDSVDVSTTVNVGELILEPGAKLLVKGNVFSLLCHRLICMEPVISNDYHIGLLPTPFSYDIKITGQIDGSPGANGEHGLNGFNGKEAQVNPQIIGYSLTHPISELEMSGTNGSDAHHGQNGMNGGNGGMLKIAEITIRQLKGQLTVLATAGNGGDGGKGGNGGTGGNGGIGANGYQLIKKILPGGKGGDGGSGGNAGNGGKAGNGGLPSNIYINVPQEQTEQVNCLAFAAVGGKGGKAGLPGKGGKGGNEGNGPIPGNTGKNGNPGLSGKHGRDGRPRPAPWMFVNEHYRTGEGLVRSMPKFVEELC